MLSYDFKEKSAREIPLPDKKAEDIEQLLKFIYPDKELPITKKNCFTLLQLANEYQIDQLKKKCEQYFYNLCQKGNIAPDEAIEVIFLSQKYPLSDQTVGCCTKIFAAQERKAWPELKKHKLFEQLDPENVHRITEERIKHFEDKLDGGSEDYKMKRLLERYGGKRPKRVKYV